MNNNNLLGESLNSSLDKLRTSLMDELVDRINSIAIYNIGTLWRRLSDTLWNSLHKSLDNSIYYSKGIL